MMALFRVFTCIMCLGASFDAVLADGVELEGLTWAEQKCVLYQDAWNWAYASVDPGDISEKFIADNTAFVLEGCIKDIPVCPRSEAERKMADMLTVMTMNEGMASTFVPFACPEFAD